MKILYISNFYDGTGYSTAAIGYVLALDAAGVDVVPRNIKLNNVVGEIPHRLRELEQKNAVQPDIIIQHTLPHLFDYNGKIDRNIGLYVTETSNFKASGWATRINTMDEAWVPCQQNKQASLDSGVTIPMNIVPHTVDVRKFQMGYTPHPLGDEYSPANKFLFYTIGETNKRKNLPALLKAFHLEFRPEEPVELVIKTTPSQSLGIKGKEQIEKICNEAKAGLKIYGRPQDYKQEKIICEYWDNEQINRLHTTCNCFVSTSHGEAWCLPAFDAMGFGRSPIVNACGGFLDYMTSEAGWLVGNTEEPAFGEIGTFKDVCTGNENWWSININALRAAMREAYENRELKKQKATSGTKKIYDYSYEKVGQIMKNLL